MVFFMKMLKSAFLIGLLRVDKEVREIFNKSWPEDYIELHISRILILLYLAGEGIKQKKIKSRTKLAKLDFFLRYPPYLKKAAKILEYKKPISLKPLSLPFEPSMIRYFYGPWDEKYYQIILYLQARNLINITNDASGTDIFILTQLGESIAKTLIGKKSFKNLATAATIVGELFVSYSGNKLKKFIYENFPEVVSIPLKSKIEV